MSSSVTIHRFAVAMAVVLLILTASTASAISIVSDGPAAIANDANWGTVSDGTATDGDGMHFTDRAHAEYDVQKEGEESFGLSGSLTVMTGRVIAEAQVVIPVNMARDKDIWSDD